jgi:hypothetical protein
VFLNVYIHYNTHKKSSYHIDFIMFLIALFYRIKKNLDFFKELLYDTKRLGKSIERH